MFCPKCGSVYPDGSNYCGRCGVKLKRENPNSYGKKKEIPADYHNQIKKSRHHTKLSSNKVIIIASVSVFAAMLMIAGVVSIGFDNKKIDEDNHQAESEGLNEGIQSDEDVNISEKSEEELFTYDEETQTLTILSEEAMFNPSIEDFSSDDGEGMESDENNNYNPPYDNYMSTAKYLVIDEGIENIASYAFDGYTSLETVEFPSTLVRIGSNSFQGAQNIEELNFPADLKKIGTSAFGGCNSLTNLFIPESVESIGLWAFQDCSGLETITVEGSENVLAGETLLNCDNVSEIYFGGTSNDWQDIDIGTGLRTSYILHCSDGDFSSTPKNDGE